MGLSDILVRNPMMVGKAPEKAQHVSIRRVLVVDDVPMNRKLMVRLLEGYCDETVQADDGALAVEAMRQSISGRKPFVLVLMDFQMPNMDGPTAASLMREMGYTGPIIGVTGNALASHSKTFVDGGANKVLSKPMVFSTLIAALTGRDLRLHPYTV